MLVYSVVNFLVPMFCLFCAPCSAAALSCASLTQVALLNTKISVVRSYRAGEIVSGVTKAPVGLCRVKGKVKPSSESNINFEVWIPTDGSWNGKYEQIGNGGFAGTIWISYIADAVSRGYAAAATDDGTSGSPSGAATFIGHSEVQKDYGYRAIKVTTDNSKAIIKKITGRYPRYSYFSGCSDGGREALMEAQRYRADFDGIIVGSPSNDLVGLLGASFLWNMEALLAGPRTRGVPDAYIPRSKLPLLSKHAISQCVGKDGGVAGDNFLNDPTVCRFDVAAAMCKPKQSAADCLTPAQITAARKIYLGPHSLTGERIFRGFEPGSESNAVDWPEWLVGTSSSTPGAQNQLSRSFWCDEVLGHPPCPLLQLKEALGDTTQNIASIVNSTNPDLSLFKNHGGKLIQYAGWADAAIPPQSGLDYYAKVATVMGDVHSFYRVFMAPGMAHCYGGAGANAFGNGPNDGPVIDAKHDLLKALELWVERGIPPEKIIATKYVGDNLRNGIKFQRPLCPYPKFAKYDGYGRITDSNSFQCVVRG